MEDNGAAPTSVDSRKPRTEAERLAEVRRQKNRLVQCLDAVRASWVVDGDIGIQRRNGKADVTKVRDFEEDEPRPAPGRRRLFGAELVDGALLAVEDGREVSWPVDLARQREAIARCETGWTLLWDGTIFRPTPMLCGQRACPRCLRARVGRMTHQWVPVFEAAHEDGAAVYQGTFTQQQIRAPGALVLPDERGRYIGDSPAGEPLPAVGGESLASSYSRWRETFHSVRKDRPTKERWKSALGGYCYGVEWTLRAKRDRGAVVPRWHCHGHVLMVVPRGGWRDFRAMSRQLKRDWCERSPGARVGAQDIRRVEPRDGQGVADAMLETLKYPMKVGDLTVAAVIEAYASLRGTRPHHFGGAFHGNSSDHARDPWCRWLEAMPEIPSWPRLHVRCRDDAPWEPFVGQIREGEARWHVEGEGAWSGDARPYWRALSEARASAEVYDRALDEADA